MQQPIIKTLKEEIKLFVCGWHSYYMYRKSKINLEAVEMVSTIRSSEVKLVLCHHVKLHYVKKLENKHAVFTCKDHALY